MHKHNHINTRVSYKIRTGKLIHSWQPHWNYIWSGGMQFTAPSASPTQPCIWSGTCCRDRIWRSAHRTRASCSRSCASALGWHQHAASPCTLSSWWQGRPAKDASIRSHRGCTCPGRFEDKLINGPDILTWLDFAPCPWDIWSSCWTDGPIWGSLPGRCCRTERCTCPGPERLQWSQRKSRPRRTSSWLGDSVERLDQKVAKYENNSEVNLNKFALIILGRAVSWIQISFDVCLDNWRVVKTNRIQLLIRMWSSCSVFQDSVWIPFPKPQVTVAIDLRWDRW